FISRSVDGHQCFATRLGMALRGGKNGKSPLPRDVMIRFGVAYKPQSSTDRKNDVILDQITKALVPVAFVIALGFLAGKRKKLDYSDSLLITRLVLNWIFPALLLAGMAGTPRAQLFDFRFIVATFVGLMGTYVLAFAVGWFRYRDLKIATLKG